MGSSAAGLRLRVCGEKQKSLILGSSRQPDLFRSGLGGDSVGVGASEKEAEEGRDSGNCGDSVDGIGIECMEDICGIVIDIDDSGDCVGRDTGIEMGWIMDCCDNIGREAIGWERADIDMLWAGTEADTGA